MYITHNTKDIVARISERFVIRAIRDEINAITMKNIETPIEIYGP
jgi:hypothetical protein